MYCVSFLWGSKYFQVVGGGEKKGRSIHVCATSLVLYGRLCFCVVSDVLK